LVVPPVVKSRGTTNQQKRQPLAATTKQSELNAPIESKPNDRLSSVKLLMPRCFDYLVVASPLYRTTEQSEIEQQGQKWYNKSS
jgi:hypothetical protein